VVSQVERKEVVILPLHEFNLLQLAVLEKWSSVKSKSSRTTSLATSTDG
jgi:hypothetical protein